MNSTLTLSKKEKQICERISLSDNKPHDKRALVLLLVINQELTHAEAGGLTGLTLGQVRYCIHRFRAVRMNMFPSQLTSQPVTTTSSPSPEPDSTSADDAQTGQSKKKNKHKKDKSKKDKSKKGELKKKHKNKSKKKDKSKKRKDKKSKSNKKNKSKKG